MTARQARELAETRRRQGRALAEWRRDPQCRARWLAAVRRHRLALDDILQRHVSMEPMSGCWIWTSYQNGGYPILRRGHQRSQLAQRRIFEAFHGPFPPRRRLIHRCGLVACVSPTHLALKPLLRALTFEELQARFIAVDVRTGCWVWRGRREKEGYGRIGNEAAHRRMFTASGRLIPPGFHLDHLSRVRHCVNPEHLQPVLPAVNSGRVTARRRRLARWGLAQGEWDEAGEREAVVLEAVAE
jgi:hypothetical protein